MVDMILGIARYSQHYRLNLYHRYLAWELCYEHFYRYFCGDKMHMRQDYELAALNLGMYLANNSFYRPKSKIMNLTYLIFAPITVLIRKNRNLFGIDIFNCDVDGVVNQIFTLRDDIAKELKVYKLDNLDLLISQIMLGTLGCTVAYDSYVTISLRKNGILGTFSPESLKQVINFAIEHKENIETILQEYICPIRLKNKDELKYPPMKILDMYFWQLGKETSSYRLITKKRKESRILNEEFETF